MTLSCSYAFDVLGELFYSKKFGYMSDHTDIGDYTKGIDCLLPAFILKQHYALLPNQIIPRF